MTVDAGAQVEMSVQEGKLVVEPKRQPRYTLAELLATCTEDNMALTDEDRVWLDANPRLLNLHQTRHAYFMQQIP